MTMTNRLRILLCLVMLATASCSMRAMIDRFTSPQDRAFVTKFNDDIRNGRIEELSKVVAPEILAESLPQFEQAKRFYPTGQSKTEIVGANTSFNTSNGHTERRKEFILVTSDGKLWTRLAIVLHGVDREPDRVIGWDVVPSNTPPTELEVLDTVEKVLPWVIVGIVVLIGGIVWLVVFLVNRSRRKRAAADRP